jgi:hypothetical protein
MYTRSIRRQLVKLEGILWYREYEENVHGLTVTRRVVEIRVISMKRLSNVGTADDRSDGAIQE